MAVRLDLDDDNWCYVCGKANPLGFRQRFLVEDDEYVTYFTPRKEHQGYKDIVHGGITSTLLDEVMARCAIMRGCYAVTAELTVRFKKPARVGKKLRFSAVIDSEDGRSITTSAKAVDEDGILIATANGRIIKMCDEQQ